MRWHYNVISLSMLTLLLVSFQNCSPYRASSAESSLKSSEGTGSTLPPKMVFMASGHVGRTVMSCDDGKSWINDRSDNDATRCWVTGDPNYLECDHTPTSGHGVDAGDGWFFANFGWGYNGSVRKTRDGVHWTTMRSDGWGGGVAYAKHALLLLWGKWSSSFDLGETWAPVAQSPWASLDHPVLRRVGDLFFVASQTNGMRLSRDAGVTWETPVGFQSEWGGYFAAGNGVLVSVGYKFPAVSGDPYVGYSARSTDNGVTWTGQQMYSAAGQTWDGLVFDGQKFLGWSGQKVYQSVDGQTWTVTPVVSDVHFSGAVSFNPETGTFVLITGKWDSYYDKQRALRSSDGITWTTLDANHFKGGHPILNIVIGEMDGSACPP